MLYYVQRVLIPYQERDAAAHNRPRGNLSDLYPRWLGARELLLHGRDPYSAEITREIQAGFYGRPLNPSLPDEPRDESRFAYPIYVVLLLAPTVTLPFHVVQTMFLWLLVLGTAASVLLWLHFLQWRLSFPGIAMALLLTSGSFAVIQGAKLQQLTLLVGFLVALATALLARGYLASAGALMALATIKPQIVVPIAGWFLLWSISSWRRRQAFTFGFAATMGVLLGVSEWLLPGWIPRFLDGLSAYRNYALDSGILETLFSPTGGKLIAAGLVGVVLALCWSLRLTSERSPAFCAITALVLTTTVVIIPMIVPYNQVLLVPAILWLIQHRSQIWSRGPMARVLSGSAALMICWPWLAAAALAAFSVFVSADRAQRAWALPLVSSLFIPLSVIALQFFCNPPQKIDSSRVSSS